MSWTENGYSKTLVSLLLSSELFRRAFEELIRTRLDSARPNQDVLASAINSQLSITLEERLGDAGRIDVLMESAGQFSFGLENKLQALLQPNQLHRYARALKVRSKMAILAFLAPVRYHLSDVHIPEEIPFVRLSYSDLVSLLDSVNIASFSETELMRLKQYFGYPETLAQSRSRQMAVSFERLQPGDRLVFVYSTKYDGYVDIGAWPARIEVLYSKEMEATEFYGPTFRPERAHYKLDKKGFLFYRHLDNDGYFPIERMERLATSDARNAWFPRH